MAWYPFCGDTTDHSGLGHTLLNYTGTPAVDTIDRFNNSHNAYYFSGGNCIMEYSTFFPNNGIPPDYTYSCWINPRVAQSSIIMYNGNPNSDGFGFVMNDGVGFPGGAGTNVGVYFGGIGLFLSTPLPTPFNTWHNLVLVKSGNSYRFYIDDVSQGFFISPFNPMSVGSVFSLGGNASGVPLPNLGFDGFIDDVAVIEKQLSNAERLSLYFFNPDAKHFTLGPDTTVCSDNMELYPNFQTLGGAYTWKTLTTGLGYVTTDTTDTVITVYPLPGPLGNSYSLTITKPFGCVASDTLTVYKSPIPVNLGLDRNFCLGDTVRLTSYFPGSKFLWSTGDTTHTLDVTSTGNYFLRIDSVIHFTNSFGQPDSSVCVGRDTVYLHASTVPLVSLPPNVNNCLGNSITVHTVFDSGYTYLWSSGSTDDSTVITTSGIIWVRVTDTGCVRTDTMTATIIDERVTLLNPDTAICQGDRVTARSTVNPIVSYQWTPTAGMAVSNLPNVFIVPDTSAWYYLTVRYPGCPNLVDSFYIDVQPRPIVSIGGNRDVCEGDTIHVTAKTSPGWYKHNQFIWTPANPNLNVTDSSTVVFYAITRHDSEELIVKAYAPVYLTGAPQCYSIDSAAIFVHPKFRDTLASILRFCPGDSLQLQPNLDSLANALGVVVAAAKWSPGLYLDDSNVHYPWIHPITSQTYRLITYSQFGCRDTTHVDIIVHPAAVINLGDSVILSPGQSHQISPLTNCNTFLWYPPLGMDNVNISDPTVSPTVSTRYIVTASTEDGCKVVDSIKIHVDPGTLISMPNAFVPGGLTNGYFKVIKHGLVGLNYFRIFDRWGNKVFETKNIDEGWDGSFNGKPQPQGVYVYDVEAVTSTGTTFHREGNVTLLK
jgi:gliding motility-associated-like protein